MKQKEVKRGEKASNYKETVMDPEGKRQKELMWMRVRSLPNNTTNAAFCLGCLFEHVTAKEEDLNMSSFCADRGIRFVYDSDVFQSFPL